MKVAVIGAGPAGMMAALTAKKCGHDVMLLEQNNILGKKMRITGKGRCNITNAGDDFLSHVTKNPRFLYSALNAFSNYDAIEFFENMGVPTKRERGDRVFPQNDSAHFVVNAFADTVKKSGVKLYNLRAKKILTENSSVRGVLCEGGKALSCNAAILATGGVSYPQTGSRGDGLKMAKQLGHGITPLLPALVPINADISVCRPLMGLSLKNIGFKITEGKKTLYEDFGEMIFTHFGISGPVVLSAGCNITSPQGKYAVIDFKPALSFDELDSRVRRDFEKFAKRDFINSLGDLLPSKFIPVAVRLSGISERKKCCEITKEERRRFVTLLKEFKIELMSFRPIAEAIVTNGGVDVSEINPKTMESKIIKGLFFAGEIIDVSAYTGGYNLQIAYSTGYVAGSNIF